jgi:hypothetical protein
MVVGDADVEAAVDIGEATRNIVDPARRIGDLALEISEFADLFVGDFLGFFP